MVAGLDGRDVLANGLDNAGALVAEHDGECAFGIFAGECVCIYASVSKVLRVLCAPRSRTYRCGRLRCNRFRCGLHAPLVGLLRSLRWRDLCLPPRPRRPVCCESSCFVSLAIRSLLTLHVIVCTKIKWLVCEDGVPIGCQSAYLSYRIGRHCR